LREAFALQASSAHVNATKPLFPGITFENKKRLVHEAFKMQAFDFNGWN
jgi:hypothetical protein